MLAAGVSAPAIEVFSRFYELLESGETGVIREDTIEPLLDPVRARTFAFDRPSETASSDHNLEHDDMAMMANFDVV